MRMGTIRIVRGLAQDVKSVYAQKTPGHGSVLGQCCGRERPAPRVQIAPVSKGPVEKEAAAFYLRAASQQNKLILLALCV